MKSSARGYKKLWDRQVPELASHVSLYVHEKTGAEILIVDNKDEEKTFGVSFRTPVFDSTGMSHVLEHSVLCGSQKYPVRDSFNQLSKGSLATYINALTYPDKTVYPVSSVNEDDLHNLIDVYLDSVFFPLLTPEAFAQEAWHYEIGEPKDTFTYKGVVFSEMKGVYSNVISRLAERMWQRLYPDTEYQFSSGGDPVNIPDLQYEQFRAYHQQYYQPSNAKFFFYGNGDRVRFFKHLDQYLSLYTKGEKAPEVKQQPKWTKPKIVEERYPVSEIRGKQGLLVFSWMIDVPGKVEYLKWDLLDYILVRSDAGLLRVPLLESGLGEELLDFGFSFNGEEYNFSFGLKGVDVAQLPEAEKFIQHLLAKLTESKFDHDLVASGLNRLEFSLKARKPEEGNRGIDFFTKALEHWRPGEDILTKIELEEALTKLKRAFDAGKLKLSTTLKKQLIDNPHRLLIRMLPDVELTERERQAEETKLQRVKEVLTPKELTKLKTFQDKLRTWQQVPETEEQLRTLPVLPVDKLRRKVEVIPQDVAQAEGVEIITNKLPTKGICYFSWAKDLHLLPPELLPYAQLLTIGLFRLGTHSKSFQQLAKEIDMYTGGVGAQLLIQPKFQDPEQFVSLFLVSGKVLAANWDKLLSLLVELVSEVKLDQKEKWLEILTEERAGIESALTGAGHRYAAKRLLAQLHPAHYLNEMIGGISFLEFLRTVEKSWPRNWPKFLSNLEQAQQFLLEEGGHCYHLISEAPDKFSFEKLRALRVRPVARKSHLALLPKGDMLTAEAFSIPVDVNFTVAAYDLRATHYQLVGTAAAISKFLSAEFAWTKVRMGGGAYGAWVQLLDGLSVLMCASYRDPNSWQTVERYKSMAEFLEGISLDKRELNQLIVGAIGELDQPLDPDEKGFVAFMRYLTDLTDEVRQRLRTELLNTTETDIKSFASVLREALPTLKCVLIGNEAQLKDEKLNKKTVSVRRLL